MKRSLAAAFAPRLPAEWEPHAATWLAWPHYAPDWPGKFTLIPWLYAELVRCLLRDDGPSGLPRERVRILVNDAGAERKAARALLRNAVDPRAVEFHRIRTDRSWIRDYAPQFVYHQRNAKEPKLIATRFRFTGWAKYGRHENDAQAACQIARQLDLEERNATNEAGEPIVLEGGAIDGNGQGTFLATEECLLSRVQARNPGLDRAAIERALSIYLGARKIIWLGRGIAGDDTHGHIDDMARFVGPRRLVLCTESNPNDPNHAALSDARRILENATDQDGAPLEIIPLPMPDPVVFDDLRLPASYANFYVSNRVVVVPTFHDRHDREALEIISRCFPDRLVIGLHCRDLVTGCGALHCITHEQPA